MSTNVINYLYNINYIDIAIYTLLVYNMTYMLHK